MATKETENTAEAPQATQAAEASEKTKETKEKSTLQRIKETVQEDDSTPTGSLTLRKVLGGDILSAEMVRRQIWLFALIVLITIFYVAFRYQCQQDMLLIDKLEKELTDVKYKALSSSSSLTEKCRESRVLDALKSNKDSVLHISDQPPYIINVPED